MAKRGSEKSVLENVVLCPTQTCSIPGKKQRLHSLLYVPYVQIYQQNSELKGCRTASI